VSIFGHPSGFSNYLEIIFQDLLIASLATEAVLQECETKLIFCDPWNVRDHGMKFDCSDRDRELLADVLAA
jgi:hypothetical protein